MQNPPDLLTAEEEKQLAQIIELDIDAWVENQKVHEVIKDDEGEDESEKD